MRLLFFGTSSGLPTKTRNVTSIGLALPTGQIWLFDCGEGTQRQFLFVPPKITKINKIFISHSHGDHLLGLPGVLMSILRGRAAEKTEKVELFGPPGLRQWTRQTLSLASQESKFLEEIQIHQLLPSQPNQKRQQQQQQMASEKRANEKDFECNGEPFVIHEDQQFLVQAGRLSHTVPSWGFVITEKPLRGALMVEKLLALGVVPGPHLRRFIQGEQMVLPDGRILHAKDFLAPPRRPRKIVILGDTSDSSSLLEVAKDADVLVHESTLNPSTFSPVDAKIRGHSTPLMAGAFAKKINANTLILTHFSPRIDEENDDQHVHELVQAAKKEFPNTVLAAKDFTFFDVEIETPV